MTRLSQIDANLLVTLDVLLEERHVTRAARRMGVTQSAMSQALQRLRDTLGDPLLVRSGSTMVTTPRADALAGPLRTALRALEQTLSDPERFDPAGAQRDFRMAMLDVYSVTIMPRLLETLALSGEGLSIDVLGLDLTQSMGQLRTGAREIAIVGPQDTPADIATAPLLRERMVSMVRDDHPMLDGPIDLDAYTRWPHAVFHITGRGTFPIDLRLAKLGTSRRIIARSPYFLSAPWVISSTDTIITLPISAARAMAARWPVHLFEPPFGPSMSYTVKLAWPNYLENEPGHRWFRERILSIGREVEAVDEPL